MSIKRTRGIPKSVEVIGLSFKIVTVLMVLAGLSNLLIYAFMKVMITDFPSPQMYGSSQVLKFMLQNFSGLTIFQFIMAIFIFIVSVEFIKLKDWARRMLKVLAWFMVGGLVVLGIWLAGILEPNTLSSLTAGFRVIVAIGTGIWIIPLLIVIFCLKGEIIKEACAKRRIMEEGRGV
jgi:hypothetical protein